MPKFVLAVKIFSITTVSIAAIIWEYLFIISPKDFNFSLSTVQAQNELFLLWRIFAKSALFNIFLINLISIVIIFLILNKNKKILLIWQKNLLKFYIGVLIIFTLFSIFNTIDIFSNYNRVVIENENVDIKKVTFIGDFNLSGSTKSIKLVGAIGQEMTINIP